MMTDRGMSTYTNIPQIKDLKDNEVTEYFLEYRRYLIYYPDSLVFMGNTVLSEEEIDEYIGLYNYAYPDTTHIWLCVDTNYAVEGDAFYTANAVYQKIVPNVDRIISLIVFLAVLWLGIGIYMTITTGVSVNENGENVWHLNRFDHVWIEVVVVLNCILMYGGIKGYHLIMEIADNGGVLPIELLGIQLAGVYRYGVFALYGIYISVSFQLIWYSMVRRTRANHLWRGSFLYYVCETISRTARFILQHKNSVISMLLPYNLFLFSNLVGIVMAYRFLERQHIYAVCVLVVMVVLDVAVGMYLFRRNVEQIEIVEAIKKIRDGEVEFKIDADKLHGSGKELADAVNNIGEGIHKAVKTSMKDERMKTDLITNVSHDIKTPLTSIINYVDLIKREQVDNEKVQNYIRVLDEKSQRLKQLTDDLVEASKISSGNINLHFEKINLTELMNQTIGEFSEKFEQKNLTTVMNVNVPNAVIEADSRRIWRVIENLFNNIFKYAMEGTRVYLTIDSLPNNTGYIALSVKNISASPLNCNPDELTERFIRGDESRTTEGSGLGLSIAKNLTEAQKGTFEIQLDGDLFKVILTFPLAKE